MYASQIVPGLTLANPAKCCGMWELNIGPTNLWYQNAENKKLFVKALKEMADNAKCSQQPGYASAGIKGAGIIIINVKLPPDGVATGTAYQDQFEPLFTELGFRRVKTYLNPRSGQRLRMYYHTGEALRKEIHKL